MTSPTQDPAPLDDTVRGSSVRAALAAITAEDARVVEALDGAELEAAASAVASSSRIFVLGAGRSGLALQMTAMRLMHLGLAVHVVGEVTAPAIAAGDTLLVASGSGTTAGILRAATTAVDVGATIVCLTTAPASPLAELADVVVTIPAAQKQDHGATASVQYAGGLFEQAVMLIGDAIFHSIWKASGATAEELWPRHANLE